MQIPIESPPHLVISNGKGRLFVQTVLPETRDVRLVAGPDLYDYDGQSFPPSRDTGPAPACRVEISPRTDATVDYFLHVLTATDSDVASVPIAECESGDDRIRVSIGAANVNFGRDEVAADVSFSAARERGIGK